VIPIKMTMIDIDETSMSIASNIRAQFGRRFGDVSTAFEILEHPI